MSICNFIPSSYKLQEDFLRCFCRYGALEFLERNGLYKVLYDHFTEFYRKKSDYHYRLKRAIDIYEAHAQALTHPDYRTHIKELKRNFRRGALVSYDWIDLQNIIADIKKANKPDDFIHVPYNAFDYHNNLGPDSDSDSDSSDYVSDSENSVCSVDYRRSKKIINQLDESLEYCERERGDSIPDDGNNDN